MSQSVIVAWWRSKPKSQHIVRQLTVGVSVCVYVSAHECIQDASICAQVCLTMHLLGGDGVRGGHFIVTLPQNAAEVYVCRTDLHPHHFHHPHHPSRSATTHESHINHVVSRIFCSGKGDQPQPFYSLTPTTPENDSGPAEMGQRERVELDMKHTVAP